MVADSYTGAMKVSDRSQTATAPQHDLGRRGTPFITPVSAVCIAIAMGVASRQWGEYDVYWHLANGRRMVEQGLSPNPDAFSWSAAGELYVSYSSHLDRLFYLLWDAGGVRALSLFPAVMFGLILLPLALRLAQLRPRPVVEAMALELTMFAVFPYMGTRPHTVAFVLFGFAAYLMREPFGWRQALAAGLLIGSWAHLHGTFYFGFGLLASGVIAWLWTRSYRSALRAGAALMLALAISMLTPYGVHVWKYPLKTAFNPYLSNNLDWSGLKPLSSMYIWMGIIVIGALLVGIWRAGDPRSLSAVGLVLPTIHTARFTPFSAPLLVALIVEKLVYRHGFLRAGYTAPSRVTSGLCVSLLLVGLLSALVLSPPSLEKATVWPVPEKAVNRLLACAAPAPVWNDYNFGGYLMWRGGGKYTVGIDGRAETLYDNEAFEQHFRVRRGWNGWADTIRTSAVQYALLSTVDDEKLSTLTTLDDWTVRYRDDIATLAVRDGAVWRCNGDVAPNRQGARLRA